MPYKQFIKKSKFFNEVSANIVSMNGFSSLACGNILAFIIANVCVWFHLEHFAINTYASIAVFICCLAIILAAINMYTKDNKNVYQYIIIDKFFILQFTLPFLQKIVGAYTLYSILFFYLVFYKIGSLQRILDDTYETAHNRGAISPILPIGIFSALVSMCIVLCTIKIGIYVL